MRALKKLSRKLINCILAISMFFGTGLTSVFAQNIDSETQLKNNFLSLEEKVESLDKLVSGSEDTIFNNIETIINNNFNNKVTIKLSDEDITLYEVSIDKDNDIIVVSDEEKKDELINAAQNVTAKYIEVVESMSLIVNSIKNANDNNVDVECIKTDITNTLRNISQDINNNSLTYAVKVASLNTYKNNFYRYVDEIDEIVVKEVTTNNLNELLNVANVLKERMVNQEYDITNIDELINNINTTITNDEISEDIYNNYLLKYDEILNNYLNMYTDEILNEIISNDSVDNVDSIKQKIDELTTYNVNAQKLFDEKITNKLNEFGVPTTEDERVASLQILNNMNLLLEKYSEENKTLLNEKIELYNKSADTSLTYLEVHGYIFTEEELMSDNLELSVANEVEEIEYIARSNGIPEILNGTLKLNVGENTLVLNITAENGNTKTYNITINRLEKFEGMGDVEENNTNTTNNTEVKEEVTTLENTVEQNENVESISAVRTNTTNNTKTANNDDDTKDEKEEKSNTSDVSDKYNEELEEEEMSPLTILLVLAGIGLIGFGIYMLFGKDDDNDDIKMDVKPEKKSGEKIEIKNINASQNNKKSKKSTKK